MKKISTLVLGVVIGLTVAPSQLSAQSLAQQGRSAITGTVFAEAHRPQPDVFLELLDDFNSTINHTKTDSSGRFSFTGLLNGNYRIRVLPYGTDYMEQTQEATLVSASAVPGRQGADRQNIDIYLKLNERATHGPFAVGPGVVFVQDVPQTAKKFYDNGVKYLRENKAKEGLESLKKSIEIFPTYYLALDRLGAEYAMRGNSDRSYWEAGLVLLTKAVEVNPRGINSVFGLGWTQYQLGLNAQAIETLERATTLYGKAADAHLWLGKALKRASALDKAEAAFKRANELTGGKVAEIHWQLASLYNDQKRYREAVDELEKCLKLDPKAADAERIKATIKDVRSKQ